MALFPQNPANNQQMTVNGITYVYNSSLTAWVRYATFLGNVTANNGTFFDNVAVTNNITSAGNMSASGNITGQYIIGNGSQLTGIVSTTAQTVTNAAQPNITSTGTLSSLSVSGNANVGNIGATNGVFTNVSGNGSLLTSITGANVTGQVGNALVAGTVYTNAQPNITSVGTLTSLSVSGTSNVGAMNVSGSIIPTANATYDLGNSTNLFRDLYLSGNSIKLGTQTLTSNASGVVLSNAIFGTSLTTTGNANVGNLVTSGSVSATGNITGNYFIGNGSQLTGISGNIANITANVISFNTAAGINVAAGQMAWNSSDGTLDIGLSYADVVLQVGQETHYVVRNDTGNIIENGTAVYCSGVTAGSGRIEASPMTGSTDPVKFLGLATQDISNGVNGVITYFGYVRGLDTRGTANTAISVGDETWAVGDQLYVHPTAAGKLTNVEPAAPNVKICVASILIRNQTSGVLFVRPTTNLDMVDLSDVQITTPAANQFLVYAGNRWENTALDISLDTTPTLGGNLAGAGFNVSNVATISATGNVSGGNIITAGNANVGNLVTSGSVSATGNITGAYLVGNGSQLTGVAAGTATTAQTVTTNAQPNITSVGTLTSLAVTGNGSFGNVSATLGAFTNVSGNGSLLTSITGANVTGQVGNALVAGTVYTAAQPNITSVGTLSSLSVSGTATLAAVNGTDASFSGNATVNGNLFVNGNLTYLNVETVAVEDPIIQLQTGANGAAPIANSGKDVGTALNYYDTEAKIAFMGWDVSNAEIAFGSNVSITNEVVTFTSLANTRSGNTLTTGVFATTLSATGNANVGNIGATNGVFTNVSGNGALLTSLNASNLSSGTVSSSVLNITTSTTDTTAGKIMRTADWGFGTTAFPITDFTSNNLNYSQIFRALSNATGGTGTAISGVALPYDGTPTTSYMAVTPGTTVGTVRAWAGTKTNSNGTPVWAELARLTAPTFTNYIGIGGINSNYIISVSGNQTGNTTTGGINISATVQNDVTSTAYGVLANPTTAANAFTLTNFRGFQAGISLGAGSTITNAFGFTASSLLGTNATNGYGFYSDLAAAANKWNFYASGTANNYMAGSLGIGTTSPAVALHVKQNGGAINVEGTDQAYIQFYPRGMATRTSYIGVGSAGSNNFTIRNDDNGQLQLQSGNSNVAVFANGNVTTSVAGVANVLVVTSTGANIAGTLSVSGNITGGNLIGVFANGNSNISIPAANGNINFSVGGQANEVVFTSTGANVNGYLSVSGNANIANIGTAGLITAEGTVRGGALSTGGSLGVTGNANIGNIGTAGLITATGNITGGNLITGGLISATGNITGGNIIGVFANGTSNIRIPTASGNINFSSAGNANILIVTGTGANIAGTLNVSGNTTFSGVGQRIFGDFSNATLSSRTAFQDKTTNNGTSVLILPNGTNANAQLVVFNSSNTANASYGLMSINSNEFQLGTANFGTSPYVPLTISAGGSERARITTGGALYVGTTTGPANGVTGAEMLADGRIDNSVATGAVNMTLFKPATPTQPVFMAFASNNQTIGSIAYANASGVNYNTSSDYRLKNTIAPMTGALDKVALLKPCTYKWNIDGSDSQGFIAHELAEVVPECVTGEKDAVDAEGKPIYQGIDTSHLVATLTAAIQEQQALIQAMSARIAALEAE
jgi:hypothetical protein